MFSIGIRYCGGCNPQIDRSKQVDFITDKERSVDIVLLINGCMHACLEEEFLRSGHNPQHISVKGEMVDDQYIKEESIPDFLIKKLVIIKS
jgi:hypothetical protein